MISDDNPFAGRLLNGENVLWSGRPGQGIVLTPQDGYLIPFSLLWCGFAVFWESSVVNMHAPLFFMLWGVPFVLVGLFMVIGRFLVDAWLRRRIHYAVTDQRLLIIRGEPFGKFTALGLKQLPQADLIERTDGSGTIRFGSPANWASVGYRGWGLWLGPALSPTPQIFRVGDVRKVFNLVQEAVRRG